MIYLDTNILIYALEGNSEFAEPAQKIIETAEKEGAILSVLVKQELLTGVHLKSPKLYEDVIKALNDLNNIKFVPVTNEIIDMSLRMTKRYGKRIIGYDAIHIATAICHNVDRFYTNDADFLGLKLMEVRIFSLNEL